MLVLSRREGEKVILDSNQFSSPIVITVTEIDNNKTRLGIEADQSVTIIRLELLPPDQQQQFLTTKQKVSNDGESVRQEQEPATSNEP